MRRSAGCRDIFRLLPRAGKQKAQSYDKLGMALVSRISSQHEFDASRKLSKTVSRLSRKGC